MSKIEWLGKTGLTWNPIIGCSKISEGCKNCYAEKMAWRLHRMGIAGYSNGKVVDGARWTGKTALVESALKKKFPGKGKKIFVGSMGDLFHESVPFEWIDKVFLIIAVNPQHTFLILTKRPERMKEYLSDNAGRRNIYVYNQCNKILNGDFSRMLEDMARTRSSGGTWWPLNNLWLGVTAENQELAEERIPILLQIPVAKRFVSIEPILGEVDLIQAGLRKIYPPVKVTPVFDPPKPLDPPKANIDWVICGGETGPGARPIHPDWVYDLKMQCKSAQVPFFFKSWGKNCPGNAYNETTKEFPKE